MKSNYLECAIQFETDSESEIIVALLANIGFESFSEHGNVVLAYMPNSKNEDPNWVLNNVENELKSVGILSIPTCKIIEQQNWNVTWEQSFEPIEILSKCIIRAPFHKPVSNILNIIIEPKMSFGTGHHQTTYLMLETIFEMNLNNMTVLDMGCGTGVLGILTEKLGAANIIAIDNEEWAFENTSENIRANNCENITPFLGNASLLDGNSFDVIFANINKSVLLNDMKKYVQVLKTNGILLLSGFFTTDVFDIIEKSNSLNLTHVNTKSRDEWSLVRFVKN